MPRGDGTGPLGEGPMTGRGMGFCAGYARPGFGSAPGRVSTGGFGRRNRFYATGVPFSAYAVAPPTPAPPREEELTQLRNESQRLRDALETIEQRLARLETA